jgi:uncharacterized small protein (DUF1192 family)
MLLRNNKKFGRKIMKTIKVKYWYEIPDDFTGLVEYLNGTKQWLQNGESHKTDGPATKYSNGDIEYWIHGRRVSKEEIKKYADDVDVQQTVLQALKDISNGAARSSEKWIHEGPRSFVVAKKDPELSKVNELEQTIKALHEEVKQLTNEVKKLKKQSRKTWWL